VTQRFYPQILVPVRLGASAWGAPYMANLLARNWKRFRVPSQLGRPKDSKQ
jgi:hypothetical protein